MNSQGAAPDEPQTVSIRCSINRAVAVRLFDPVREDPDCLHYTVEADAPGLKARVDGVAAWIWDADLAPFLAQLAADFRGWDGERVWQTNDRDLMVAATFRSGGHVALTWTLRPWRGPTDSWEASITTWLEAGEQMAALASEVHQLLRPEHPG
ncbi:DUF6228 family protein [Streptomyces sp. NPDC002599]|uniref:DUF6228 family protein n=1 Tax=Streptomyces sp. NPDC002599 TaxID=3154421 RepID=UPI003327B1C1